MTFRAMPVGLGLMLAGSVAAAQLAACGSDNGTNAAAPDGGNTADSGNTDSGPNTGAEGGTNDASGPITVAPGPTRGAPIAISADDSTLVVANRDSGSVSVFSIVYNGTSAPTLTKTAEVSIGNEPWQIAISNDGTTAYAVLRKDQQLVEVTGLKSTPTKGRTIATGSEPTAVALTPTGATAWVANWVDGTVMGVDTASMAVTSTVDLNTTLAASGMIGAGVTARAAMAHPRSIAITNNGDTNDGDETMLVTEFFAQRTTGLAADYSNADTAKSGVVYKVKLSDKTSSIATLAPIAGINANSTVPVTSTTGPAPACFPNQLQSISINAGFAYVTSVCASPNGPLSPVADTHGAVSVLDINGGTEVTTGSASYNQKFDAFYATNTFADDATRRYPAIPSDIGFVNGKSVAYVPANGADGVFRATYDTTGAITAVGLDKARPYIDLLNGKNGQAGAFLDATHQGKNPVGIAMPNNSANSEWAFVSNDVSRNVSIIDFESQDVAGDVANDGGVGTSVVASTDAPTAGTDAAKILTGKRLFNTGTARWSRNGQAWQACQSCHIDGLTDNITWEFNRGPRQSVSLDGSFSKKDPNCADPTKPCDQRIFNWTAVFDEVADFEGNVRNVSGGKGAITDSTDTPIAPTTGPGGSAMDFGLEGSSQAQSDPSNPQALPVAGSRTDWLNITQYISQLRSPRAPTNLVAADVTAGGTFFQTERCNGCHGGDKWTVSQRFYTPLTATTDSLAAQTYTLPDPTLFPVEFDPATNHTLRTGTIPGGSPFTDATSIQCALRKTGTFNVDDAFMGIAELKSGGAAAQGGSGDSNGYNAPSLLGVSVGAPYFHAGQAATLEAAFNDSFATHHATIDPNAWTGLSTAQRATQVSQLVAYVLSIDNDTTTVPPPATGLLSSGLCPLTFP